MDKKISELTVVQAIDPADVSILVHNNTDYQFSFTTLLTYISSNIQAGAAISFGTTLPQNNIGKNGDVFINTALATFAQKLLGVWTVVYTLPINYQADGTLLFGLGAPNSSTGKNGDSYIDTGNGIFYKKADSTWSLVFTMLNGPPGAKGDKGDTGIAGTNGKAILNGTVSPSNLTTGTDGDFYIKTNSWQLFGPKTSGIWPAPINLADAQTIEITLDNSNPQDYEYSYDGDVSDTGLQIYAEQFYTDPDLGDTLIPYQLQYFKIIATNHILFRRSDPIDHIKITIKP